MKLKIKLILNDDCSNALLSIASERKNLQRLNKTGKIVFCLWHFGKFKIIREVFFLKMQLVRNSFL